MKGVFSNLHRSNVTEQFDHKRHHDVFFSNTQKRCISLYYEENRRSKMDQYRRKKTPHGGQVRIYIK
jgi:hypothetical protein